MKEPAKDFNQFSELKITKSSRIDAFAREKSEPNPNLPSTSANENENKKLSSLRQFLKKAYRQFRDRIKSALGAYSKFYDRVKPVLKILWIVIGGFFILSHLGAFIIARSLSSPQESPSPQKHSKIIFDESKNAQLIFISQTLDLTFRR